MLPSFPGDSHSKESACNGGDGFDPWVRKIPWRREWLPIPVFLPREFHGQKSLVGYRPWGCKESDMIEQLKCTDPLCNTLSYVWTETAACF